MRDRIEAAFGRLGVVLHRRAWWVIGAVLLVVGVGVMQIPKLESETSIESFLHPDDPVRVVYEDFLLQFGRDDALIIAIEPPEIFDFAFLEKLRRFHEAIEDGVPHVHEVQSLINARYTRGVRDQLIVGDLFEDWPRDDAELATIRDLALANPLYRDLILSSEGHLTTVTVKIESHAEVATAQEALAGFDDEPDVSGSATTGTERLSGEQERELVDAIQLIADQYDAPDFRLYAAGAPVINSEMMISMVTDIIRFAAISIVVIGLLLTAVFRRVVAVVVPLVVAVLSVVSTLGLMGAIGIPLMPISEIVPSFLLSVGVGGNIHLLTIYFQKRHAGASSEDALSGALQHSGLPITMTALTTAGGLASFSAAEMIPVAVFGTVGPLGVLVTLLLTLSLGPAMTSLIAGSARSGSGFLARERSPASITGLVRAGSFAMKRSAAILAVCGVLVVFAAVGTAQLVFRHNPLDWFPDDTPAKVATIKLNKEMGGSMALEFLIDTGEENGLRDPALLQRIDEMRVAVGKLQVADVWVGKSISLVDIVKEIHSALNADRPDAQPLPDDPILLSQELLLFENSGSDDLEDVVDPQFRIGRISMKVPFVEGSQYLQFGSAVLEMFVSIVGESARLTPTGLMTVMGRSVTAAIETMTRSYVIALAVITPLMIVVLGSLRLGLLAMIPNLFPILLTLGLMGWLGIPLDMFSLLIGSIALGLAVDDTIHFMHGFRRTYERTGDVETAVTTTLRTTGQAMLFTSVVLSTGFFIYVFSSLENLTSFGLLTAFAIVMAFLSDVLLAPALMARVARHSNLAPNRSEA